MDKPILAMPRSAWTDNEPFGFDQLERKKLADVLTGYIDRLKTGAVIAIDAEWGQGKTWFARNWKQQLHDSGHPVVYIDAFQSDYMEDPFLLIASEITALINDLDARKSFIDKAKAVGITIAPAALKLLAQAGGKLLLGLDAVKDYQELAEKAIEGAEDPLGKMLESRIKNYEEEAKSIEVFRQSLRDFAHKSPKPIVIFIDELDRCQPTFAVRLLERLKHLFDVENVIFVLCVHKVQMQHAIQGVYGQGTNGHTYLEKFLNFTFTLNPPGSDELAGFIASEYEKCNILRSDEVNSFLRGFSFFAVLFRLTPRQIERGIALLALASPVKRWGLVLSEVIALQVSRPELFGAMIKDDVAAIRALVTIFEKEEAVRGPQAANMLKMLKSFHAAALEPENTELRETVAGFAGAEPEFFMREFKRHADRINIPIF